MITDDMLLDIAEIVIEPQRVTLTFRKQRPQYIFTNGWKNANDIAGQINRQMMKIKLKKQKDEKC